MNEIMYSESGAAILREAQEILRERGWIKFNLENEHGVCAMGAIHSAAAPQEVGPTDATNALEDAMYALRREILLETGNRSITDWNDSYANSIEDILLLLKRAEDRCHEQSA